MINNQLDIKFGQFTQEEFNIVLRKIENRKAAVLYEIPPEVWKKKNSMTYCFDTATPYITITQ